MNPKAKLVMAIAVSFLTGIASLTFAQDSSKNGVATEKICPCPLHKGMGKFPGGKGMFPESGTLSEEQIEKLEAQRKEFLDTTRDLQMELRSQRLALKSELAKKEPDVKNAKALQKEISALNAELGQKRIEHLLAMKKIAPYSGMGQFEKNLERPERNRYRHRFQRSNF